LSELVFLKQNIGTSDGDSTPPEAESLNLPLIEAGVLEIYKSKVPLRGEGYEI